MYLKLREIITRELMWSKSLSFAGIEVSFTSVLHMDTIEKEKVVDAAFAPEAIENLMAKEMEQQYPVLIGTFYTLMDPEEMTIIKKQAQEAKRQNRY